MIDRHKFDQAGSIMNKCEEDISNLLGVPVRLLFEVINIKKVSVTPMFIIRLVSEATGTPESVIKGATQDKRATYARYVAWYLMRKYLMASFTNIAKLFGKHHSTVMWGLDVIKNEVTNLELQQLLKRSESMLKKYMTHEDQV